MGYILTGLAAIIQSVCNAFAVGSGDNVVFTRVLFTGVAVLLTVIGVIRGLINSQGGREKLITLGIHAAIWVVIYFGTRILIPVAIFIVVAFVADRFLLGGTIWDIIVNKFLAGKNSDGTVTWPSYFSDDYGNIYQLDLGSQTQYRASYICQSDPSRGFEIDRSALASHDVETVYGTMHW